MRSRTVSSRQSLVRDDARGLGPDLFSKTPRTLTPMLVRIMTDDLSPSIQLMQLIWPGAIAVQAIHVAAALGIPDLLAEGTRTVDLLAAATDTHAQTLRRLMRALTSLGIFAEVSDGAYRHTALSDVLRRDHPESMHAWAVMLGAGFMWQPIGRLGETVKSGKPAFEEVFGRQFFEYLSEHSSDAAVFDRAMSSVARYTAAIVNGYDFSGCERIVDIGGGRGVLLNGILSANPRARGLLYDLPGVLERASPPGDPSVAARLEMSAGSFFNGVPSGADTYILSGVLHDWDDESAKRILTNVRRSIRTDGRLLIMDTVLTESTGPERALMDVLMMVLTGGRERTESEFRTLLHEAGFLVAAVIQTRGTSILDSRPI